MSFETEESALREGQERFRLISEYVPDAEIFRDENKKIAYVNPSFERIFGYSAEEYISKKIKLEDICVPKDLVKTKEKYLDIFDEKVKGLEVQFIRKDGALIYTSISSQPIIIDNIFRGIRTSIRDITERKKAEEIMIENEKKYRYLFSEMMSGFALNQMIFDKNRVPIDYITLEVNKAFENILGVKGKDIIGKTASSLLPKDELKHWLEIFGDVTLNKKERQYIQYSAINDKYFEGRAYSPKDDFFAVTFNDITQSKKAQEKISENEKKFQGIFENSQIGMELYGQDGKLIDVNKSCMEIFGVERRKDVMGFDLFKDPNVTMDIIKKLLKKEIARYQTEFSFDIVRKKKLYPTTKSGKIYIDVIISPLPAQGKESAMYLVQVMDITERKKYEQKILDARDIVEEEVKEKTKEISELYKQLNRYTNSLKVKLNKINKKSVLLTNKEKLGFYALVRYANLPLEQAAKKVGLNRATLGAIRNRLKKEGYYKKYYIPRYDLIGICAMGVRYKDVLVSVNTKHLKEISSKIQQSKHKFYACATKNQAFSIDIAKDSFSISEANTKLDRIYQKWNIEPEKPYNLFFNLQKAKIINYFDFAGILRKKFSLIIQDEPIRQAPHKEYALSAKEKKLMMAMINDPESTYDCLSKKTGISKPTIIKSRKKFLETGMLKPVIFPDFKKIGFEIISFIYHRCTDFERITNKTNNEQEFFSLESNSDHISIGLYENYTDFKNQIKGCPLCKESMSKVDSLILPVENLQLHKIRFDSPLEENFK